MPNRSSAKKVAQSRRLRREATDAERLLWWALRGLKARGYHFRRQAPFESYILDFVEHGHRLVIEVDGSQHASAENRLRDERRDEVLRHRGYKVFRVWNNEVTKNLDGVIDTVLHLTPTRSAGALRPPRKGEVR
jgi:very-short-patch-repair endonuclease